PLFRSNPTAQTPQELAIVFVRALLGPRAERRRELHTLRELGAARLARRCLLIASGRLPRRPAARRNRPYRAFELDDAAHEGHEVAGTDAMCRLDALAVDVHPAAAGGLGRQRARFEQPHSKRPAVDTRGAQIPVGGSFRHRPEYNANPWSKLSSSACAPSSRACGNRGCTRASACSPALKAAWSARASATSSISAPTIISDWPVIRRCARPRTARSTASATAWPRCVSSA